ncbi:MAG: type IV pili methyl-accepting chemotaxis transducer N-terminal domain-containing protein [Yoonia sp.]|uniref:type IV pili methyl-accepting chemotaxis transducer N-terminal domain-containing protein n=1 Tax=Yoonia sp. TaxID=2212373 RepID=UPI00273FA9E8|nr:type IV pili methyl-accepting chemotaxis transducer N-terminal domain-containing protein [Yoonia sp.]MDP5085634.1 type IV pili methyl-accepting chemotaxis transducer N-terminal domain-containing protein [Yoonia sp.]
MLTAQTVAAQSIDESLYNGGKARVNRSASLRSLTEAVASASCRANGGIGTEEAQRQLASWSAEFDTIIDGLVNGSPALGMPTPETRAKTLKVLNDTAMMWQPLEIAANKMSAASGSSADATTISSSYRDLFEQTELLAAAISGQYSDPQQLLQSDATVLNFAVRQRALAYRMTRAMCELATGTGTAETQQELQTTVDLFQQTLFALRDGFPAAGINPPPNDAVRASIEATFALWQEQRGIFDAALAGQSPSAENVVASATLSEALSVAMNNTITLYLIATPGQDDVYRVPLEAYARGELTNWLSDPALIAAINAQNAAHADLTEEAVIALDQQWRAEAGNGGGPLIESLLTAPVSTWLLDQQVATAGFVTEVFIMDNKGLNVAQSVETSDYWQGDEAKWQETYSVGPNALHISEVEFDDSTGFYQSQASLSITDPATGEVIGAVTFGINVQNLM